MFDYTGQIVQATAGRDRAACSVSLAWTIGRSDCCWRTGNGERSPGQRQKKLGHIRQLAGARQEYDHPAIQKLRQGEPVSDRELRRALAAFKEGITLGER
ncbi:MAG: hypothetical protein ACLTKB_12285 [Lawsonibacter sp.]